MKKFGNDWIMVFSDQVQGIKMEPSNQAEALKMRELRK